MKYESSYSNFDEFVREVIKPNSGPAWSVDNFVDELFSEEDQEYIPGVSKKKKEEDEDGEWGE